MSLADEIETQLKKTINALAEAVGVTPGSELGLAWGEHGEGRIVIPLDIVAKLAADVAQRHARGDRPAEVDPEEFRAGFLDGWQRGIQS